MKDSDSRQGPVNRFADPFVIGVVGGLGNATTRKKLKDRRFVTVDAANLAQVFERCGPRIGLSADQEIRFPSIDDLSLQRLSEMIQGVSAAEASAIATEHWKQGNLHEVRATWTGLKYLLGSTSGLPNTKVKCLDCFKREALRDLQRASDLDRSALYKIAVDNELGTMGGEPFGCIVFSYSISKSLEDLDLAERLMDVAGAASTPAFLGIEPSHLTIQKWQELNPKFLRSWMAGAKSWNGWATFRASMDAEFCFAFLPRIAVGPTRDRDAEPSWIHPGFFAAAAAAQAFRDRNLSAIARRLFVSSDLSGDALIGGDLDLEWNCPEELIQRLRGAGLNAFSGVQTHRLLRDMVSYGLPSRGLVRSLASALLIAHLRTGLQTYVRSRRSSDSHRASYEAVEEWVAKFKPASQGGSEDAPFESVSINAYGLRTIEVNFQLRQGIAGVNERPDFTIVVPVRPHGPYSEPTRHASESVERVRAVALIDVPAPYRKERLWATGLWDADNLFEALDKPAISITVSGVEAGRHLETTVERSTFKLTDMDDLIAQNPLLKQLAAQRAEFLSVASHADLSSDRKATLTELMNKRGALRAILKKVEGWKSAVTGGQDSPVTAEEIDASLPASRMTDWDVDWDLKAGIAAFEALMARIASDSGSFGWFRIHSAVESIDAVISRYIVGMYHDPIFQKLESVKESLRRLLANVGRCIEVTRFDAARMETLDYLRPECPDRNVIITELSELGTRDIEAIRALLELDRLKRTVVILGLRGVKRASVNDELTELAKSPLAANLLICAADLEVPRHPLGRSVVWFPASPLPALPSVISSGAYVVAETVMLTRDEVFRNNRVCLDVPLQHFKDVGWEVLQFGRALLLLGT